MNLPECINTIVKITHDMSRSKGFYDGAPTDKESAFYRAFVMERLALIHSEVSEVAEEVRRPGWCQNLSSTTNGKPTGVASEIADVVIRCFDLAGFLGIDLQEEIARKVAYNANRPRLHGKGC